MYDMVSNGSMGSPPRVRSRPVAHRVLLSCSGITSACAEQTSVFVVRNIPRRDHLRVCGADVQATTLSTSAAGSPPRVRSRRPGHHVEHVRRGITSACAEQTRYSNAT